MNLRKDHYHTIQTSSPREEVPDGGRRHNGEINLRTTPNIIIQKKGAVADDRGPRGLRLIARYRPTRKERETEQKQLSLVVAFGSTTFLAVENAIQLSAMDVLDPTTMKNAAKCDT